MKNFIFRVHILFLIEHNVRVCHVLIKIFSFARLLLAFCCLHTLKCAVQFSRELSVSQRHGIMLSPNRNSPSEMFRLSTRKMKKNNSSTDDLTQQRLILVTNRINISEKNWVKTYQTTALPMSCERQQQSASCQSLETLWEKSLAHFYFFFSKLPTIK